MSSSESATTGAEAGVCLVYTTFPSRESAETAGRAVVEAGLAACANVLPGMISHYRWKGAVERAEEVVMILKTRRALATRVGAEVQALHPYETPAILVLDVSTGSAPYLAWIASETAAPRS